MIKDISRHFSLNLYKVGSILILMFIASVVMGQEICDNGIDDDGDGKIDLLDEDCDCQGFTEHVMSLIPNPSFEKNTGIPTKQAELNLAEGWDQATSATTDYIHTDGFKFAGIIDMPLPIPNGDACAGMLLDVYDPNNQYVVQEYLGANLLEPMSSGIEYTLNMDIGFGVVKDTNLKKVNSAELTIYGRERVSNFPINTYQCPLIAIDPNEEPEWEVLAVTTVNNIDDGWTVAEMTFTPTKDYESIIIGGSCSNTISTIARYIFIDNLICSKSSDFKFGMPTTLGSVCEGTLELQAPEINLIADYQWYKDGIAIVGETGKSLPLGDATGKDGYYQVRISYYEECMTSDSIYITGSDDNLQIIGDTVLCYLETTQLSTSHNYDSYKWSNGDATQRIVVDEAGIYSLTVTRGSCEYTSDVTVREVPEIIVSGSVTATEYGESQGTITITIDGGEAPFSYQWLDGPISKNRINIPGGSYTINVEDRNGCIGTKTFTIKEVPSILIVDEDKKDINCYGEATGEILLDIHGGIPPYQIGWAHTAAQLDTLIGLTADTYEYTISDDSGQSVTGTITIDQSDEITAGDKITHLKCYEDNSGEISLNPKGGSGAYEYSWNISEVGDTDHLENLSAGIYLVDISDENNCTKTFEFSVTQPDILTGDITHSELKCYGVNNAEIMLSDITGGTQPYRVLLDGDKQASNFNIRNLSSGEYTITIVDKNNCTYEEIVTIDEMEPVELVLSVDKTSIVSGEEVEFELSGVPGSGPNGTIVFGSDLSGDIESCNSCYYFTHTPIRSTRYYAEINELGCSYKAEIYIDVEAQKMYIPNAFSPNGDNNNDHFRFYSNADNHLKVSEFSIYNKFGARVYSESDVTIGELAGWDGYFKGQMSTEGVYTYRIVTLNRFGKKVSRSGSIQLLR